MRSADREISGIGGWLAFLIVVLCVISPTLSIVRLWQQLYSGSGWSVSGLDWQMLQQRLWGVATATSIGSVSLGALLITRRRRSTVTAVVAGLWIIALCDFLVQAAAVSLAFDAEYIEFLMASGYGQLRPFAFCAIWTAYLLRSRRVANTYARHPASDELEAVFD